MIHKLLQTMESRRLDLNDQPYADIMREVFGQELSEDESRKRYYGMVMMADLLPVEVEPIRISHLPESEKTLIRDERNLLRQLQREQARDERYLEVLERSIKTLDPLPKVDCDRVGKVGKSIVIQLSDWHFGLKTENPWNVYNVEVFNERLESILRGFYDLAHTIGPEEVFVLFQGDLISGNIKNTLRLQNQENIIGQIMLVAEKISHILSEMEQRLEAKVHACFVCGNHERVMRDKKDNLSAENYTTLIKWYVQGRLGETSVDMMDNSHGLDLHVFETQGQRIGVVHGDKDPLGKVVANVGTLTGSYPDIIFTAHRHHLTVEDLQKCRVIGNGSLVGMDDYSQSLRLNSYPSQNVVVVGGNKEITVKQVIA